MERAARKKDLITPLKNVIYMNDPWSKFRDFSKEKKFHAAAVKAEVKLDDQLLGKTKVDRVKYADVVNDAWLKHFRENWQTGDVIQVDSSIASSLGLGTVRTYMSAGISASDSPDAAQEVEEVDAAADVEFEQDQADPSGELALMRSRATAFFRVAHKSPGNLHLLKARAYEGANLSKEHICLQELQDISLDGEDTMTVNTNPKQMTALLTSTLHRHAFAFRGTQEGCVVWNKGSMVYTLAGIRLSIPARKALTTLVRNSAWKPTSALPIGTTIDEELVEGLRILEELGYALNSSLNPACSEWHIAEGVKGQITYGTSLSSPVGAFSMHPNKKAEEVMTLTNFELVLCLESKGWVWQQRLPLKTKTNKMKIANIKPVAVALEEGQERVRVWYTMSGAVRRAYVQVLLKIEQDPQALIDRHITEVPHFAEESFYSKVLDLLDKPPGPRMLQNVNDVQVHFDVDQSVIPTGGGNYGEAEDIDDNEQEQEEEAFPDLDFPEPDPQDICPGGVLDGDIDLDWLLQDPSDVEDEGPQTPKAPTPPEIRDTVCGGEGKMPDVEMDGDDVVLEPPLDLGGLNVAGPGPGGDGGDGPDDGGTGGIGGGGGDAGGFDGGGDSGGPVQRRPKPAVHWDLDQVASAAANEVGLELVGTTFKWGVFTFTYRPTCRTAIFLAQRL
jgi:hypothetical protein